MPSRRQAKQKTRRNKSLLTAVILSLLILLLLPGLWLSYDRGLDSLDAWRDQLGKWQLSIEALLHSDDKARNTGAREVNGNRGSPATEPLRRSETSGDSALAPKTSFATEDAVASEASSTAPAAEAGSPPLPENAVSAEPPRPELSAAQPQIDQPVAESAALPASTVATVPPAEVDNGIAPTNLQIIFDFDSAELSASAKANLDEVASEFIAAGPGRIRVMGYADNRGDQNYNIDLSQRRANAVAQYLVGSGVDSTFLEVQGLGIFDAADARQTETDPPDISGRVVQLHVQFDSTAWR
ncbi:OmpA family protein [Seongchinamella sediminis]|uniref:OmpA family protein n=1 Tax=Seongchinamella sediminis TaxID=2283635 RepID=UPI0013C2FD18|nr:OmpA family protein [Seongchinamella sediminis]